MSDLEGVKEIYQKEVLATIVRHVQRLMDERFNGEIVLTFRDGATKWVEIQSE